jgi:hypothetical protein
MATDWAPPRSNQAPRPPAPPADLDSPAGELALLRALVAYRLVGPHKHVQMAALLNRLAKDPGMRSLSNRDVWAKWNQLYDADTLEQVWKDQASHAQRCFMLGKGYAANLTPVRAARATVARLAVAVSNSGVDPFSRAVTRRGSPRSQRIQITHIRRRQ